MKLPGRLSSTTLGDILGLIHRERASGVLELLEERGPNAGRSHRIYFGAGLIEHVETTLSSPRLGELLVREGLIGLDGLRRLARRLMFEPDRRAGQILIEEGVATIESIAAGLRRQRLSRLEAVFQLREALLRFHVPRPGPAGAGGPPLTPREFLHDRPRARSRQARGRAPSAARSSEESRLSAYRALGLPPNADGQAVRKAFRRLAAAVHPDRFPRATPAEKTHLLARFAEFSAAYHTLTT